MGSFVFNKNEENERPIPISTKFSNCVEVFEQVVVNLTECYISFEPEFLASPDRLCILQEFYTEKKILGIF